MEMDMIARCFLTNPNAVQQELRLIDCSLSNNFKPFQKYLEELIRGKCKGNEEKQDLAMRSLSEITDPVFRRGKEVFMGGSFKKLVSVPFWILGMQASSFVIDYLCGSYSVINSSLKLALGVTACVSLFKDLVLHPFAHKEMLESMVIVSNARAEEEDRDYLKNLGIHVLPSDLKGYAKKVSKFAVWEAKSQVAMRKDSGLGQAKGIAIFSLPEFSTDHNGAIQFYPEETQNDNNLLGFVKNLAQDYVVAFRRSESIKKLISNIEQVQELNQVDGKVLKVAFLSLRGHANIKSLRMGKNNVIEQESQDLKDCAQLPKYMKKHSVVFLHGCQTAKGFSKESLLYKVGESFQKGLRENQNLSVAGPCYKISSGSVNMIYDGDACRFTSRLNLAMRVVTEDQVGAKVFGHALEAAIKKKDNLFA